MARTRLPRNIAALVVLSLLAATVLATSACAPTPPSDPPGITGTVSSVTAGDGRPASMLVEGPKQPAGAVSDKALVTIPPSTMFFDANGAAASLSAVGGIHQGTKVRVWFEGAIAESYPVQGSAKAVQILGK